MQNNGIPAPDWAQPVRDLAERVVGPGSARSLCLESLPEADGRSAELASSDGVLTIRASDALSASVALHHYLRTVCGRAVHWDTALPLNLAAFPRAEPTSITARVREQYLFNFCTFGYTMTYWGWQEWEKEIDWMALHGITMPLAITGHEAVIHNALRDLGVSSERALEFVGSPAYVAWAFMGCLEGELPAMDTQWLDKQTALGQRILERERSFGMTPVLPAFTGQLPRELAPEAVSSRFWQGHETWVISPEHPLFVEVGTAITRAQIALFGTDHLYASDPFIEMLPTESDPHYPGRVAQAVLAGLIAADDKATWVLQAWPFADKPEYWVESQVLTFLDAIDPGRLLILDLWAEIAPQWERFDSFSGTPWIWCGLLNFGGRSDPMGDVPGTIAAARRALAANNPPEGLGLAMEATRNNYLYFELLADLAWYEISDVQEWMSAFAAQRYGHEARPELLRAWSLMSETVYTAQGLRLHPDDFRGVLGRRPSPALVGNSDNLERLSGELVWYQPSDLVEAWELFTATAEAQPALAAGPLGRDLVDAAVAVLSRVADILCLRVLDSNGADARAAAEMLALYDALDAILACHPEFRFSTWERAAAEAATGEEQRAAFVTTARQLLTTWNAQPATVLDDYAGRIWQGLVGGYYRDRWSAWLDFAAEGFPESGRVALEDRLDRLSADVIANGVPAHELPRESIGAQSRAALTRFAPTFLEGFVAGSQ